MRAPALRRAANHVERFALAPASARPLAALRIGLAGVLLAQAIQVAPVLAELYGERGVLQGPLREAAGGTALPRFGLLWHALAAAGVPEGGAVAGTGVAYVAALAALLVGHRTRVAAGGAWLTHMMLMAGAPGAIYGADELAHVGLFYLVLAPAGASLSLDKRRGRAPPDHAPAARLGLRVLQLHLCMVYASSGIEKALGPGWRNGEAIWRALMLPEYRRFDFSFLAAHPWLAVALGWLVLLVEIGYPVLVWPRRTRRLWVGAVSALHLGIAVFMGLAVFGAVMIVLSVAAFGVPAEPVVPAVPGPRAPPAGRRRKRGLLG